MARLDTLNRALTSIIELRQKYPSDSAIEQIAIQLQYLVDLEDGKRSDRRYLENINIGILTVREIEPLDAELATLLYDV